MPDSPTHTLPDTQAAIDRFPLVVKVGFTATVVSGMNEGTTPMDAIVEVQHSLERLTYKTGLTVAEVPPSLNRVRTC